MAQNGGGGPPPPRPHPHHRHQQQQQQQQQSGRTTFGQEAAAAAAGRAEAGTPTRTTAIRSAINVVHSPAPILPPTQFFPTATAATTTATTTSPLSHQRQDINRDFISLSQPRPGIARIRNEYIETPLRPPPPPLPPPQTQPLQLSSSSSATSTSSNACSFPRFMSKDAAVPSTKTSNLAAGVHHQHQNNSLSIRELIHLPQSRTLMSPGSNTRQLVGLLPSPTPMTGVRNSGTNSVKRSGGGGGDLDTLKNGSGANSGVGADVRTLLPLTRSRSRPTSTVDFTQEAHDRHHHEQQQQQQHYGDSIICRECKRCKCAACSSPRPLPAAWICKDKYQCSAETVVDQCSCMCCVKGVFYHTAKDYEMDDDVSCADQPCSCDPHRRCTRWACVGLLTALLPCLLCYWPLRGCFRLCELCYTAYNKRHACQCAAAATRKSSNSMLLSSSTSSSMLVDAAAAAADTRRKVGDMCSPMSTAAAATVVDATITVAPSSKRLLHQHDDHRIDFGD